MQLEEGAAMNYSDITRNSILWLSASNWIYDKDNDLTPIHEVHNLKVTAPLETWKSRLDEELKAEPDFIVFIITEPVLLLMLDEEFSDTVKSLFRRIMKKSFRHAIMVDASIYHEKFSIFEKDYAIVYLYRELHEYHQMARAMALKSLDFETRGEVSFTEFFPCYIQMLVLLFHDNGCMHLAERIFAKTGNIFSTQEIEKIRLQRMPIFDSFLFTEEHCFDGIDECWNQIRKYLDQYGTERTTKESKARLIRTLDQKTYRAVIECLDLMPNKDIQEESYRKMAGILEDLKSYEDLDVIPFRGIDDLCDCLDDYIGESRRIVYNQYILYDRMYADEMDSFMSLFQEYVTVVRGIDIRFEKEQTAKGIIYILKSYSPEVVRENFTVLVDDFQTFIKSIEFNVDDVALLMKNNNITKERAEYLIRKYTRELKRIKFEIQQDYERRRYQLKDMLQYEIEGDNGMTLCFPQNTSINPGAVYHIDTFIATNADNPNINLISGDLHYNDQDRQIIELIKKYGNNDRELINALNMLKDEGVDQSKRKKAGGKLKRFIEATGKFAKDIVKEVIVDYVESMAGMNKMNPF